MQSIKRYNKRKQNKGKPQAIVLDTIKGQGVKHLEEKADNHHIRPNEEDWKAINEAIETLEQQLEGVLAQ